ncbi:MULTISPECIES: hypothetical protein [unclassified Nostoc]|uniref:hypothetical protein n=1 Tax=unclassified Nostoc TaxID=2593658 RepID=UPI000B9508E7|nr:hypothetical protein [Nostoc sp. 'Peltigera membranacea cyanobiont' 232]OYE01544.1 hypothetical protein CDG79_29020 [Nostoc sp. 'Peltigera membranacea cyanobiont' 232]
MSIPNEREIKSSEVKQESYTDTNGNTHTHLTRSSETVNNSTANPNSYQNGYVEGRNSERTYQQADLAERDEKNASGGLLLGIIVTSLLGLIIGGVWYFNQSNKAAVDNTVPVLVPVPSNSSSPTPSASASPQPQTTIIERTREVPVPVAVPVPQQQVVPPAPRQPNINITIPPQQPAAEKAPSVIQPTPKATQSPTSNTSTLQNEGGTSTNTVTPSTKNDASKTTPPQGADQSNSTSNGGSSTTSDTTKSGSGQ